MVGGRWQHNLELEPSLCKKKLHRLVFEAVIVQIGSQHGLLCNCIHVFLMQDSTPLAAVGEKMWRPSGPPGVAPSHRSSARAFTATLCYSAFKVRVTNPCL